MAIGELDYDANQIKKFITFIDNEYLAEILVDNLPGIMNIRTTDGSVYYEHGYPVGGLLVQYGNNTSMGYALNNHLDFKIFYNDESPEVSSIVGFEISPRSIRYSTLNEVPSACQQEKIPSMSIQGKGSRHGPHGVGVDSSLHSGGPRDFQLLRAVAALDDDVGSPLRPLQQQSVHRRDASHPLVQHSELPAGSAVPQRNGRLHRGPHGLPGLRSLQPRRPSLSLSLLSSPPTRTRSWTSKIAAGRWCTPTVSDLPSTASCFSRCCWEADRSSSAWFWAAFSSL